MQRRIKRYDDCEMSLPDRKCHVGADLFGFHLISFLTQMGFFPKKKKRNQILLFVFHTLKENTKIK